MDSKMSRNKIIEYVFAIIAILIVLLIGPFRMLRIIQVEKSDETIVSESDPISVEYNMTQMFEGVGGELKSVDLYISNDMADQIMTFRLYDENHEQIYEQFVSVPNSFVAPDFLNIPVRFDIEGGKEYSFIVEGLTQDLYLAYEDRATSTSPANIMMAYGGAEVPEYSLVVRYNYACSFTWWQVLCVAILLGILYIVLSVLLSTLDDRKIELRKLLQFIVNPITIIAMVLAFVIIMVKKLFGIDTKNNAFLTIGVWLLLAIPAIIVNFGRISLDYSLKRIIKARWQSGLRIIAIATVLWYCYDYMNGLYDIYHYYSISKLVIAFLCLVIATYDKSELLIIPNAIWLIVGPIIGYFYHKPQIGVNELDELYRLNAWVIAIGGFVVINIIYTLLKIFRKKITIAKFDWRFGIPFAIFAIGICALANTRYWPGLLVGICLLLIYRIMISECFRRNFTQELCAGIILNFYMMVWFSINHRPYYFYQFYRYNMGFHTVTVTAYYLAMIMCAAWIRLYVKNKTCSSWWEMIPRLFTFGMAATYLVFTMSRTGFLSTGAMLLFAIIVSAYLYESRKVRLKTMAKIMGFMVAAFLYMFPVTFFLTDVTPRLANDPIVFDYEWRFFSFTKGMPYESVYYMTIEQFVSEFGKKVFGIDPDKSARIETTENPFVLTVYAADGDTSDIASEANVEDNEYEDESIASTDTVEDVTDMSNGRFDIFKCYISNWNLWGHDEMGVEMPNGEIAVHAHNTFLQVAHDHGVVFGVFYILFIGYVILLSLFRAYKAKDDIYRLFCPIVVVGFVMAGLVEWLMHPCNPFGLVIFMAMMPLFFKDVVNEKSN